MPHQKNYPQTAARAARKAKLQAERLAKLVARTEAKKRSQALTKSVRTKLRFNALKKEAAKELSSLAAAIRAAEKKLKARAKLASLAIEKFNSVNDSGGVGNPAIQDDFDFDDAVSTIEGYLEELLEVAS